MGEGDSITTRGDSRRPIIYPHNAAVAGIRACLQSALGAVSTQNFFFALPNAQLARAVVLDDLCATYERCHALGVDDATLACAAAEGTPGLAELASVLYAARGIARAVGVVEKMGSLPRQHGGVAVPESIQVQDIGAALERAQAKEESVVVVPRELIVSLGVSEADDLPGAIPRMLRAAYGGTDEAVAAALTGFPYAIDQVELGRAWMDVPAAPRGPDLKLLATKMKGGPSRDAAFAAATAIEIMRALGASKKFTLQRAVEMASEVIQSCLAASGSSAQEADITGLRHAAVAADAVWAVAKNLPPPRARVQALLDGLQFRRCDFGTTLVPRGCVPGATVDVEMSFTDTVSRAAPAGFFDELAGVVPEGEREIDVHAGRAAIVVAAPLHQAIAAYVTRDAVGSGVNPRPPHAAPPQWDWPVAQPAALVKASGMTFSASRLNSFVKCSRRWFYEYLCAAIEEPTSMQAAYGRVLHAALEALHREIRSPGEHAANDMLQRLLLELDIAFGKSRGDFASQLEYEVSRQRARRIAEQYVRWLEVESRRAPMEIAHVELSHRFSRGGHQFVGYIDRVDQPKGGGPVTIFDYKTGRIDADPKEYLEKVRRGEEAQLALYYAMRSDSGDKVGRIALVSLRDPRDPVWILALDIVDEERPVVSAEPVSGVLGATCSRADLDASFDALLARCDLLTKVGIEHFAVGEDPPCNYCAYNLSCRERPADGERIFAR